MNTSLSPAAQLSLLLANTRFEDFPAATVHKAKLHFLDTLGVGIGGADAIETRLVLASLGIAPGSAAVQRGAVPVWGSPHRLSARDAALVNGVASHALELDDTGGCDHSGAVVVPAILAALAEAPAAISGKRVITAFILGYEAGRRVLEATGAYEGHNETGWHSTGTCGPFGAAVAMAHMLALSEPQQHAAIGIAGSFSAGLWAFVHDGSQTKKLHAGRAAEGGVMAATLAQGGFTGPDAIFSDVWGGFIRTFTPAHQHVEALTQAYGENWRLNRCSIKPYAACRGTHSSIDALGQILDEGVQPADIAKVTIALSSFLNDMCGSADSSTLAAAQLSLPYTVAARAIYGRVGWPELQPERRQGAEVLDFMRRVQLDIDPAAAIDGEPTVTVHTRDGRTISRTIPDPLGSPTRPLSDAAISAKFRGLAGGLFDDAALSRIEEQVMTLEQQADCRALSDLMLCTGGRRS